ncbi:PaaI family thioesterase [Cohaesibacter celericrescens]|uniref:Thioesterase n=2 Tax=Cohaesibacter celericrescens TaxID=2067669 RepID=A0A2N5XQC6_9HYPH|nr:PaaI family thioesterase [Cohaesibacter celericrescens]PLW76694.1 thioesterase [Cohaesibacter celericrescens]
MLKMGEQQVQELLDEQFPQLNIGGRCFFIDWIKKGEAMLRLKADERHLRPGGTVSGPAMMSLSDYAAYVLILAELGPVALAVTTSLNINFLSKPAPGDILAHVKILKSGRRLVVVEVDITSNGNDNLVAHATATYSIPPVKSLV